MRFATTQNEMEALKTKIQSKGIESSYVMERYMFEGSFQETFKLQVAEYERFIEACRIIKVEGFKRVGYCYKKQSRDQFSPSSESSGESRPALKIYR